MNARIAPIAPPYTPELGAMLEKWMPPNSGVEPLKLFRTIAKNERVAERMRGLGGALLGRTGLPMRVRELLILRTTARCGAEYEWGVHVAAFAAAAGLADDVVEATARRPPAEGSSAEDRVVLQFVDELHDEGAVSDATWGALAARFDEASCIEMLAVVGYYHLISFITNGARIEHEPWARKFPAAREER
ncbi:MAG TPA: carboxymuconolactone decarboxylase family protein [Polyangiaceae bacterium]|nr:carboxymuconolactone decarboxylase family protein [Polyangiaceae bacterium]